MTTASLRALVGVACFALASGCASTYAERHGRIRSAYESYQEDKALELLKAEATQGRDIDKLLVMLDHGAILHAKGDWQASIEVLQKADDFAQQLDTVSVSEEVGAVLSNEGTKTYRGEDYEKLLISVMQAINYAQLGKEEDALVEVRRLNDRLEVMIAKQDKKYEQLAIARYLSAVLHEDQHEWDDAAIDYLAAAKVAPDLGDAAAGAVLRLAKQTERDDDYQALKKKYPGVDDKPVPAGSGQVVVVLEAGKAPRKTSSQRENRGGLIVVPVYDKANLVGVGPTKVGIDGKSVTSAVVTSVNDVARRWLEDRIGKLIAKSVASLAVKAGAAAVVGGLTKSKELGALAFGLMTLTQQADTRSWLSLPAEYQVARAVVAPGKHTVSVNLHGHPVEREVEVKAGRIGLVVIRQY